MATRVMSYSLRFRGLLTYSKCCKRLCGRSLATTAETHSTVDQSEVDKHSVLLDDWWNPHGGLRALHSMNELRVPFIRDGLIFEPLKKRTIKPLLNKRILDVGCGGGILSEPLAKLGAEVTGVDASSDLITLAKNHANLNEAIKNNLPKYIHTTIEEHAETNLNQYDGVVASEIIEHVTDKELFIKSCLHTLKPDGKIFFTTPNRTNLTNIMGVFLAENVFKVVPKGTHDYNKFIKPTELTFLLERNGCHVQIIFGAYYSVLANKWCFIGSNKLMYFLQAVKIE